MASRVTHTARSTGRAVLAASRRCGAKGGAKAGATRAAARRCARASSSSSSSTVLPKRNAERVRPFLRVNPAVQAPRSDVGIISMDVYFPSTFVDQTELEAFDGVSAGKYTIGLGQQSMAFTTDREDIYSMALTAVANFMEKSGLDYKDVGRLEVATETILDHSKSVKTYLMSLFAKSGNHDIEGVDSMNACYAGTHALFNSLAWVESSAWDGRYAMCVAGDIAEYTPGPARPTGGAGVTVFLVGPNAPLVVDTTARASFMSHEYDFYKPFLSSPFPVVDGKGSQTCYLNALDSCYRLMAQKTEAVSNNQRSVAVNNFDHILFHAPYNKLVRQSLGRMLFNDFLADPDAAGDFAGELKEFADVDDQASYTDGKLIKAFTKASEAAYNEKTAPSTLLPTTLGNTYTGSLYTGLISLLDAKGGKLAGSDNLLFSYGSGLAASLFSVRGREGKDAEDALEQAGKSLELEARLQARVKKTPEEFTEHLSVREELHHKRDFKPSASIDDLKPGTFYLTERDELGRRFYDRK